MGMTIIVSNLLKVMSNERLGKVIIDGVRLCYIAQPETLEVLRCVGIGERVEVGEFSIIRISGLHFQYYFRVLLDDEDCGHIYFGRYGDDDSSYIWLKIDNRLLYEGNMADILRELKNTLNLTYNNITSLDLAVDSKKNFVYTIRKLYKDKNVATIVNGKEIYDRKKSIPELHITYKVTLDRLKDPTFYCCQREAVQNKRNGIYVCAYNKLAEIEESSHKEYVAEYYGCPKSLHRLEVRLNYDYLKRFESEDESNLLFNREVLTDIFHDALSRVIRFRRGRKRLHWKDILSSSNLR